MKKLNWLSIDPNRNCHGKMITLIFAAILFSASLEAQEKKPRYEPVRSQEIHPPRQNNPVQQNNPPVKQVPVRQEPQPRPKQENYQPKVVPVKPVQQQPRPVKPQQPVQNPNQVNHEPRNVPLNTNPGQPKPVKPVTVHPKTITPNEPVKPPKQENNEPKSTPLEPGNNNPKTVIPREQAHIPNVNTQPPANGGTVQPVRVAPPPPNYVRHEYDPHNPAWRYSHFPRWHSHVYNVPAGYRTFHFRDHYYRYYDGIFYLPSNNYFIVTAAPLGLFIDMLPFGYTQFYVQGHPYYYYGGNYFDYRDDNYYVVSPPVGAIVESLPNGYETIVIDGETYYEVDGAQYKPVVQENGEIWYEVIKANN